MLKEINEKVSHLCEDSTEIKIDIATIKEHLKTLNGNVQRHENSINILTEKQEKTSIRMAKYFGAGAAGGLIPFLISLLIKGG